MKVLLLISMLINWPPADITDYERMVLSMGLIIYQDGTSAYRDDAYHILYNDQNHIVNLKKEWSKEVTKVNWLTREIENLSGQQNKDAVKTRNLMLFDQGLSEKRAAIIQLNIRYFESLKMQSWPN